MKLKEVDKKIITVLGENSRATYRELSKKAKCTVQTARSRLKKLENEMNFKHTIEPNPEKFGYSTEFFIKIKFKENVTGHEREIFNIINKNPYIQFAALTRGDFEIFLWAIAPSRALYEVEMEMPVRVGLDKYIEDWSAHGLIVKRGGFLPVSNKIIEMTKLDENIKKILLILNTNSRTSLTEIAKKMKISKPSAKYYLDKIKENYVKRFTSYFNAPKELLHAIRFFQVTGNNNAFKKYGPKVYDLYLKQDNNYFNKTVYATVPDGGIDNFFLETFADMNDYNKHAQELQRYNNIILKKNSSAIITEILKGAIPIRKIELTKDIPFLLSICEMRE